jgi:hypothetical protein
MRMAIVPGLTPGQVPEHNHESAPWQSPCPQARNVLGFCSPPQLKVCLFRFEIHRPLLILFAGTPLRSEFRPSVLSGPAEVHNRSHVVLKKILCVVDAASGTPEFESSVHIINGKVRDVPFGSGAMKHVYDVRISFM